MTKQKYPDKELVAVFEPHTYSRTERFLNEYAKVLDLLIIFIFVQFMVHQENQKEILQQKKF